MTKVFFIFFLACVMTAQSRQSQIRKAVTIASEGDVITPTPAQAITQAKASALASSGPGTLEGSGAKPAFTGMPQSDLLKSLIRAAPQQVKVAADGNVLQDEAKKAKQRGADDAPADLSALGHETERMRVKPASTERRSGNLASLKSAVPEPEVKTLADNKHGPRSDLLVGSRGLGVMAAMRVRKKNRQRQIRKAVTIASEGDVINLIPTEAITQTEASALASSGQGTLQGSSVELASTGMPQSNLLKSLIRAAHQQVEVAADGEVLQDEAKETRQGGADDAATDLSAVGQGSERMTVQPSSAKRSSGEPASLKSADPEPEVKTLVDNKHGPRSDLLVGSRALEVLAAMRVRMIHFGVFHMLGVAIVAAMILHVLLRSQLPQPSRKKPFPSNQSSDREECAEAAEPKVPASRAPSIGADVKATGLDAFGKLVLPSRETWYIESLGDIVKESGTFKILCMSGGIPLQANISSESSPDGPRRSLEIFDGKSLISRVCSSVRLLRGNGQQEETSSLRLSILDAKYKHLGQLRFVTPTHFDFLLNAELIANLDIDEAGRLEISTASGNRMACVSDGSDGCGISVDAWMDTGLVISLVLASIILREGADKF